MTAPRNCLTPEVLAAFIDGELRSNESAAVETHLATCESCRGKVARLRALGGSLKQLGSPAPNAEFVRGVQRRMALAERPQRSRAPILGGIALAAAVAVVLTLKLPKNPATEFQARGKANGPAFDARHLGFDARAHSGTARDEGTLLSEGATVHRGDGFTFTLHNLSGQAPYFMILGVDAQGEVHWFYPSFPTDSADPVSSRMPERERVVPLPEGVVPEAPAAGKFRVVAIFSKTPLQARDVEARLKAHAGSVQQALPEAVTEVLGLELSP